MHSLVRFYTYIHIRSYITYFSVYVWVLYKWVKWNLFYIFLWGYIIIFLAEHSHLSMNSIVTSNSSRHFVVVVILSLVAETAVAVVIIMIILISIAVATLLLADTAISIIYVTIIVNFLLLLLLIVNIIIIILHMKHVYNW